MLAGLFALLTLYSFARGAASDRAVPWYVLAVLSCGLGYWREVFSQYYADAEYIGVVTDIIAALIAHFGGPGEAPDDLGDTVSENVLENQLGVTDDDQSPLAQEANEVWHIAAAPPEARWRMTSCSRAAMRRRGMMPVGPTLI